VVRAMQTNPHSVEVQEKGCGALQKLAAAFQHTRENQTRIASAGGIEVVVRAMQANPHSVEVQEKGCGALWSLASSHAENQTRIASAGGIEAVVRATQMDDQSAPVQEKGCGALSNLVSSRTEYKIRIASAGGIMAILKAMQTHENSTGVQEDGCRALLNFAYLQEDKRPRSPAQGHRGRGKGLADADLQYEGPGLVQRRAASNDLRIQVAHAVAFRATPAACPRAPPSTPTPHWCWHSATRPCPTGPVTQAEAGPRPRAANPPAAAAQQQMRQVRLRPWRWDPPPPPFHALPLRVPLR